MASLAATTNLLKERYLPLIKSRQTFLLALTGIAGYLYQAPVPLNWQHLIGLVGSLLGTISGCTVLNMLFDRDIDCQMERTRHRPLATGQVQPHQAAWLGGALIVIGLAWAASLSMAYFTIVLAGALLNVVVYTLWFKRRSAWSILVGGLAGGMPILAGRFLAIGHLDLLGLLLALVIVCWIPGHNLTLTTLYARDYLTARVPTFINVYGQPATHIMVTLSNLVIASLALFICAKASLPDALLVFFLVASVGLVGLAGFSWLNPAERQTIVLYKYSSLYLLLSMLILAYSGLR